MPPAHATLERALVATQWDSVAEADARRVRVGARTPALIESVRHLPTIALMRDGRRVGTLVYDVQNGCEYFVAVLAGDSADEGGSLLGEFLPHMSDHARKLGCTVIRGMTERPGMVRQLTRDGWHVGAVIMEKTL